MPIYSIIPQDVLFFRDGRPMASNVGSGGHGARWPEPSIMFDAFHGALHRAFPVNRPEDVQDWEHVHHFGRNGNYPHRGDASKRAQRFGSLLTAGPFPCVDVQQGHWLFRGPADVLKSESGPLDIVRPMQDRSGSNNLRAPLEYTLASRVRSGKETPPPWWSKKAFEVYLNKKVPKPEDFPDREFWEAKDLFDAEWNTGIEIENATETQDGKHIYSAEYLRLRDQFGSQLARISMGLHAQMRMKDPGQDAPVERLSQLFPQDGLIVCGGQQRCCHVEEIKSRTLDDFLPVSAEIMTDRVKWILLTPAIFPAIQAREIRTTDGETRHISPHPGGWLPNWVAPVAGFRVCQGGEEVEVEKGRVLLKPCLRRRKNQSREDWRTAVRNEEFLDCRLVAACLPKPIVLSGWSERIHLRTEESAEKGPKPTLLAIPAGSVYYFEGKDAPVLAETLAWHGDRRTDVRFIENRRSTLLGEKGYGLGVCAPWQFHHEFSEAADK